MVVVAVGGKVQLIPLMIDKASWRPKARKVIRANKVVLFRPENSLFLLHSNLSPLPRTKCAEITRKLNGLHPSNFSRCVNFPFCLKLNLCPTLNPPSPLEFSIFLSSLAIDYLLPPNLQAFLTNGDPLSLLRICKPFRHSQHNLDPFILTGRYDIPDDKITDRKLVLVVDGYGSGVGRSVCDFREGTPGRLDRFGRACVCDL